MGKQYYISLLLALLVASLIPVYWYYSYQEVATDFNYTETVYNFENVEGAIQPIPRSMTIDKNWLFLGKALFHSSLLSSDNTVSCASCHMVDFGGDDGFPVSTGVNNAKGNRNSPTVLNSTFNFRQFWDGRAGTLSEQASGPIHNPVEMASSWAEIIPKLNNDTYFNTAFNKVSSEGVTPENVIRAITIYEESLITPNSAIDRYLLGDDDAISAQQKRGLKLFVDYGCSTCHQGRNIGGNIYQKLGRVNDIPAILSDDRGLFEVTQNEKDKYIFKVPTLRNIAETAPYFHNGSVETLPEAIRIMAKSQLARELSDSEVDDIAELLKSFSSKMIEVE